MNATFRNLAAASLFAVGGAGTPRLERRRGRSAKRVCRTMPEPGLGGEPMQAILRNALRRAAARSARLWIHQQKQRWLRPIPLFEGRRVRGCAHRSARQVLTRIGLKRSQEIRPSLGQQLGGGVLGEAQGLGGRAFAARGEALTSVGREDHAAEGETAAVEFCKRGDRRSARAFQLGEKRALGGDGERGRLVIDGREQRAPWRDRRCASRRRWHPGPPPAASPPSTSAR